MSLPILRMKTRSFSIEGANSSIANFDLDGHSQVKPFSSANPLLKATEKGVRTIPFNLLKPQFNWRKPITLLFLSFCSKYKKLFKHSNMKKRIVWEKIANDMLLNGYNLNGIQVENKWKNLLKNYKKYKNRKNGYFEYLDHVENLIQDIRPHFMDESTVQKKTENIYFSKDEFWLKYYKECQRRRQERTKFQLQVIRQNQDLLQKLTEAISENEKIILQRYNKTVNNLNEVKVDKKWTNDMAISLIKCDEKVGQNHTKEHSISLQKVNGKAEKNFKNISRLSTASESLKNISICLPTNNNIKEELNTNTFYEDELDFGDKNLANNMNKISFNNEADYNSHCSYVLSSVRVGNDSHVLPVVKPELPCDLNTYSILPIINQEPLLDLPGFSDIKELSPVDFNASTISVVKEELLCDSDSAWTLNNNSCINKFKCDLSTVKVELYEEEEPSSEENCSSVQCLSTNSFNILSEENHEQLDVKPFLTPGATGATSDLNLERKECINILLNISRKRRRQCESISQKMTETTQNLHKQLGTRRNFTEYGDHTEASSERDNVLNNFSINFNHLLNRRVSSFKKKTKTKPLLLYSKHPLWFKAYFKMAEKRRQERDNLRKKIQMQYLNITENIVSLISTTIQQSS